MKAARSIVPALHWPSSAAVSAWPGRARCFPARRSRWPRRVCRIPGVSAPRRWHGRDRDTVSRPDSRPPGSPFRCARDPLPGNPGRPPRRLQPIGTPSPGWSSFRIPRHGVPAAWQQRPGHPAHRFWRFRRVSHALRVPASPHLRLKETSLRPWLFRPWLADRRKIRQRVPCPGEPDHIVHPVRCSARRKELQAQGSPGCPCPACVSRSLPCRTAGRCSA